MWIFFACARGHFLWGALYAHCTLCTRRLINIYERCLTIQSPLWEGSITKKLKCPWRAFLFVWLLWLSWKNLTSFENCQNRPLCWPCRWRRWWWWYYVDLNLDLTERAAEAVVQVAASQTQQERNYHLHHLHHHYLQLYHFVTLHFDIALPESVLSWCL